MAAAKIDIVELGFRTLQSTQYLGATAYTTDAFIERLAIPQSLQLAVMLNAKELLNAADQRTAIRSTFARRANSQVSMVRIAANRNEVATLGPAIEELRELGYDVALNLMQISEIALEHITAFGWASPQEIDDIMALAIRVNDFLSGLFLGIGIQLVDFKIECGRLYEGDMMRIILADEISPDSCRLWDIETREKLDKDRFRHDMGGLLEAYQEVAKRLGIINENEPLRGTGPVLVK